MSAAVEQYVDSVRARVVQDAWAEATALYWLRRAEVFEAARPRRGDFLGRASREDLRALDARLQAKAEACRARARVAIPDEPLVEVAS